MILLIIIILAGVITLGYNIVTGIPPFPSTQKEVNAVITLLKQEKIPENAVIYELGCGWGTLLSALAKTFPNAKIIGIEISPIPWLFCYIRMHKFKNVKIKFGNFFSYSLSDADAITAYLMIKPMVKLSKKLEAELKPKTPVVTVAFCFKDQKPTATIQREGLLQSDVTLYKLGKYTTSENYFF